MSSSTTTTSDTCSSRHLSWLMKSCFPNPNDPQPHHPSPLLPTTTISSLSDDLLIEILSRVPHSTLPSLPLVSRRWEHLLNTTHFHTIRQYHHPPHHTLFSISTLSPNSTLLAATLPFNHNYHTWKLSSFTPSSNDAVSNNALFSSLSQHFRLVSVTRTIYIISPTSTLAFDTWTGALAPKPPTLFPRKKFATAAINGRIYLAGGCSTSSAVEEYDPDENAWRAVSDAPRRRYGCIGAAADGVFYVIGGLKVGACNTREPAHVYASSMDLYDVSSRAWLRSRVVPTGGCVIAACSANGDVYVLSSHAVELSFWRFGASRGSSSFGEWSRVKSPPLPAQVRLDGTVRFSCVGVGDRVVLVQVVGCIDDLLRRSGRTERGLREGLVLVYDCRGGEWSRGADVPEVMRRAAVVCVEC